MTTPLDRHSSLTLTAAAVEQATAGLKEGFRERMEADAANLARISSSLFDDLILAAYKEGLRDGFVQGATAQAEADRDA